MLEKKKPNNNTDMGEDHDCDPPPYQLDEFVIIRKTPQFRQDFTHQL